MRNAKKTQNKPKPINQRRTVKATGRYGQAAAAVRSIKPITAGLPPRDAGHTVGSARANPPKAGRKEGTGWSLRPSGTTTIQRRPISGAPVRHAMTYANAVTKSYNYPDGSSQEAVVHATRGSYNKAVQISRTDAALAEGSVWKSEPAQEFAEIKKDGQHLRVSGREFLSEVYVLYDVAATDALGSVGERVSVRPLSPDSIGGRIQRLAELYESHKCMRFRVTYAPVVPATTAGALAMAFVNDVATTQQVTGVSEMVHLSTACDFVEFPVWQTCTLDIDPERFTRELADEQEGDARFTTDGLLVILLAGPISNAGPGSLIFGNLFIEYEYDFSAPLLDLDVAAPISGSISVTAGAATATTLGSACLALGPVPGAAANWAPTGFARADCPDYIMTVTIQAITVTTSLPVLRILDSTRTFSFAAGQTYFCRSAIAASGTDYYLFYFDSLEAASNFVFDMTNPAGALTSGQVLFNATSAAGTHQYTLKAIVTAIDISDNGVV